MWGAFSIRQIRRMTMIRFVKKADPQPLPKVVEDKRPAQSQEPAVQEDKKSRAKTPHNPTPQATDDRLI
jgi:hypothetical protein